MAKLEIKALGSFCAHCEELKLEKEYDEKYDCMVETDSYQCANVEHCRWVVDEYSREQNEKIGTIARRKK